MTKEKKQEYLLLEFEDHCRMWLRGGRLALMKKHPLISIRELAAAFDTNDNAVRAIADELTAKRMIAFDGAFCRSTKI